VTTDPNLRVAPLVWLGRWATTASPESVKTEAAKLAYLRNLGADRLDLSAIPPNGSASSRAAAARRRAGWSVAPGAPTSGRGCPDGPARSKQERAAAADRDRPLDRYCFRPQVPELSNGPSAEALSVMLPYLLS